MQKGLFVSLVTLCMYCYKARQAWIDLSVISITKLLFDIMGRRTQEGDSSLVCDEEERRAGQRTLSRFAVVNTEGNVVQGYEQSCLDAARGNSHKKDLIPSPQCFCSYATQPAYLKTFLCP